MKISIAVRQKFHGYQLAQQLYNRGLLDKLFTAHYGPLLGKDNSKGYTLPRTQVHTHLPSAIRTYLLRDNGFGSDNRFGNWVAGQLHDEDIIVTWGIQALPIIRRAQQKGIRVVLERGSAHVTAQMTLLLEEYRKTGADTRALEKSFSAERLERECLEYELADIISIPSSFVKDTFIKNGVPAGKLFVNPYGADLEQFRPAPVPHNGFRFISAGALSIRKGTHLLLKAFHRFPIPDTELWLIGSADKAIQPFIERYAAPNIRIIPAVPQHELPGHYNQCDAFVIASIEEGLAMVQLQAMACGLPLLCTTNTGGNDLITEGQEGLVVNAGNADILREAMLQWASDPGKCREMGKAAAAKMVAGYSWKDYGQRAIEKYKLLC